MPFPKYSLTPDTMYKAYIKNSNDEIVFYASHDEFRELLRVLNTYVRDSKHLFPDLCVNYERGRGTKRVRLVQHHYVHWQGFRDRIYILNRKLARDAPGTEKAFFEEGKYTEPVQVKEE